MNKYLRVCVCVKGYTCRLQSPVHLSRAAFSYQTASKSSNSDKGQNTSRRQLYYDCRRRVLNARITVFVFITFTKREITLSQS